MSTILQEIQRLSLDEELELIENIWRIVLTPSEEPLEEEETTVLTERAHDAIRNPHWAEPGTKSKPNFTQYEIQGVSETLADGEVALGVDRTQPSLFRTRI